MKKKPTNNSQRRPRQSQTYKSNTTGNRTQIKEQNADLSIYQQPGEDYIAADQSPPQFLDDTPVRISHKIDSKIYVDSASVPDQKME